MKQTNLKTQKTLISKSQLAKNLTKSHLHAAMNKQAVLETRDINNEEKHTELTEQAIKEAQDIVAQHEGSDYFTTKQELHSIA